MIHYHGTPITPATACVRAIASGHAFVSWAHPNQFGLVAQCASSFALDNGAFSAWRSGSPIADWSGYYEWVDAAWHLPGMDWHLPGMDWAIIPDVIDGTEAENDRLVEEWSRRTTAPGVPVWHMDESTDRLKRLASEWTRVAIGSSGRWDTPGTAVWWHRMAEAMNAIVDDHGRPRCKLHGLRMLSPKIFTRLPLSSADSTNIARNIGLDSRWSTGSYPPPTRDARAMLLRDRIESEQAPTTWLPRQWQPSTDLLSGLD